MSIRRERSHQTWNAYDEDEIEAIERAIDITMTHTGASNKGEALSHLSELYVELGLYDAYAAETVENAIEAAMAEDGVDERGRALVEVCECYTGWNAYPETYER